MSTSMRAEAPVFVPAAAYAIAAKSTVNIPDCTPSSTTLKLPSFLQQQQQQQQNRRRRRRRQQRRRPGSSTTTTFVTEQDSVRDGIQQQNGNVPNQKGGETTMRRRRRSSVKGMDHHHKANNNNNNNQTDTNVTTSCRRADSQFMEPNGSVVDSVDDIVSLVHLSRSELSTDTIQDSFWSSITASLRSDSVLPKAVKGKTREKLSWPFTDTGLDLLQPSWSGNGNIKKQSRHTIWTTKETKSLFLRSNNNDRTSIHANSVVDALVGEQLKISNGKPDTSTISKSCMCPSIVQQRGINITKLRDRWWDLVQEHKRKLHQGKLVSKEVNHMKERNEIQTLVNENNVTLSVAINDFVSPPIDKESICCSSSSSTCSDHSDNEVISIQEIIRQGDTCALYRHLNTACSVCIDPRSFMSHLYLAVHSNQPKMLSMLCDAMESKKQGRGKDIVNTESWHNNNNASTEEFIPPLLLAVEQGYEECIQILLSTFGPALLLTTKDAQGNTAIHNCCRQRDYGNTSGGTTTFNLLLDCALSLSFNSKNASSFLFKMISCRNQNLQTPFHIACQHDRADIVDCILTHRSMNISLLSKLLLLQDADGQTPMLAAVSAGSIDVVMSLQMWRGNNYASTKRSIPYDTNKYGSSIASDSDKSIPCPLIWAVLGDNVEMVSLLLEFNTPTRDSGYDLNDAIYFAARNGGICNDILCVLVEAGANPCATRVVNHKHASDDLLDATMVPAASAVAAATLRHDHITVITMLDSYQNTLAKIRGMRRRDPKLQTQPESFFANMECTENAEWSEAMRDALVIALYCTWHEMSLNYLDNSFSVSCYSLCALALYQRGTTLNARDIHRLHKSMLEGNLCLSYADSIVSQFNTTLYKTYLQRPVLFYHTEKEKQHAHFYYSRMMLTLPWSHSIRFNCAWLSSFKSNEGVIPNEFFPEPDLILVCEDGARFLVHRVVITQSNNNRFAAAIRFSSMCHATMKEEETNLFEMKLAMRERTCRWMLMHMYHGSIAGDFPENSNEMCQELFELLLSAEESICKSLVLECELRLLSSMETFDRCFCSYCSSKAVEMFPSSPESSTIKCSIEIIGPSMMTASAVLDILAIVNHITTTYSESDYALQNTHDDGERSKSKQNSIVRYNPMEALRECAVRFILQNFLDVVQSSAFATNFEYGVDGDITEMMHGQEIFLQMCLDDLYKFKTPTTSNRKNIEQTHDVKQCPGPMNEVAVVSSVLS